MRKLELSLIADESSRKTTFMKRKKGIMKKLNELTTLCGVQACGVIYSPFLSAPEVWPSKEGIEEVTSKFMEMPVTARKKKMMNQETFLREKIAKVKDQVDKVAFQNQELQLRQFMFDCLEGKMSEYRYGAKDLHDLNRYITDYIGEITRRIQILAENGESSSVPPLQVGVLDAGTLPPASEIYDHILPQNMNINQTQQETIYQHHVPINSYDMTQYGNMNMNQNQMDPVQYQTWNQDMDLELNHNHNLNFNADMNSSQYLSQQQSFMDMMVQPQMDYAGGYASIPSMDVLPSTTSHMPSVPTSIPDVYTPYINNNL